MTTTPFALLAPVPLEHLRSGLSVHEGRVAFASRASKTFEKLDAERNGMPVDVFIYASRHAKAPSLEVSWCGQYVGHVKNSHGARPADIQFRPPSTLSDTNDYDVVWQVANLHELQPAQRLPVEIFSGYYSKKKYKQGFAPERPLIVAHPLLGSSL